jgi:hypothetical protein
MSFAKAGCSPYPRFWLFPTADSRRVQRLVSFFLDDSTRHQLKGQVIDLPSRGRQFKKDTNRDTGHRPCCRKDTNRDSRGPWSILVGGHVVSPSSMARPACRAEVESHSPPKPRLFMGQTPEEGLARNVELLDSPFLARAPQYGPSEVGPSPGAGRGGIGGASA